MSDGGDRVIAHTLHFRRDPPAERTNHGQSGNDALLVSAFPLEPNLPPAVNMRAPSRSAYRLSPSRPFDAAERTAGSCGTVSA